MDRLNDCYKNSNGVAKKQTIAYKIYKAEKEFIHGDESRGIEMIKETLK